MSVLANSAIPSTTPSNNTNSVTGISVIARVDYNLRFTKQAVLVVGDDASEYSQLASQYLVSLSNASSNSKANAQHYNVAFVAASSKINDIQMRCRLVEQLFANTLFDPEQSLAVSVINFAKQQSEAISIVVDHAHALSLQVKYELCQLVSLAKKHKLTINVVLFGLSDAAEQLTVNKSLFKNKIAIIEAGTGQVLSMDDKKFTQHKVTGSLSLWQKFSVAATLLVILAACIWLYLLIVDDANQAPISNVHQTVFDSESKSGIESINEAEQLNPDALTGRKLIKKQKEGSEQSSSNQPIFASANQATNEDITAALFTSSIVENKKVIAANTSDILHALSAKTADAKIASSPADSESVKPNYYLIQAEQFEQGYVVQIAGFSDEILLDKFMLQHKEQGLHTYQRQLSGKSFSVVTSKVYQNKSEAKQAMAALPAELQARKPWLKGISSITAEINTFNR